MEKNAVFAPMPSASDRMATSVTTRRWLSARGTRHEDPACRFDENK
jgi:hypothetical protein